MKKNIKIVFLILFLILFFSFTLYAGDSSKIIVAVKIDKIDLLDPHNHPRVKHTRDVRKWMKDQIDGNAGAKERQSIELEYQNSLRSWDVYEEFIDDINKKITLGYPEVANIFPESDKVKIIEYNPKNYSHYILFIKFIIDHSPPIVYAVPELHNTRTHNVIWLENRRFVMLDEWINNSKFKENHQITGYDLAEMTWKKLFDKKQTVIQDPNKLLLLSKKDIPYVHSVELKYKHNKSKKIANGKDKGFVKIVGFSSALKFGHQPPYNLVEYTLKAKQGVFTKNNTKEIKFTPYDYLQSRKKLEFEYKTYDCKSKNILDKNFETFTLTRSSFLGKKNSTYWGNTNLGELKILFQCGTYYTVKLTRIKDIIKNGINRGLKATSPETISLKEMSKRVIFIDPKKGEIKNVPLNSGNYSARTGYKQAYDYKNCKVYLKALDKKEDRDSNRAVVRVVSTTPNKIFNEKTRLIFDIMDVEPLIEINWDYFAHYDSTFNKKGTYVKTNIPSKTIFGDPEWYEKIRYVVKKAEEMHIDSKCNIEDVKEFARGYWIDMPAYKLSYEYDMNIRPSTKLEIREAKLFLKNMKHRLKDKQLYKTVNSTKNINEWIKNKKNKKNQEKLKKKMDDKIDLLTD